MNVEIIPSALSGEIIAPSSKSFAHRAVLAAYLSGRKIKIENIGVQAKEKVQNWINFSILFCILFSSQK